MRSGARIRLPWQLGRACLALALAVIPASWADAGSALEKNGDFRDAMQALHDHLPTVAAEKLKKCLAAEGLSEDDRVQVAMKLGEAWVRANQPDSAMEVLADPLLRELPEAEFWNAQALVRNGRFSEAEKAFAALLDRPGFPYRDEVALNRAAILVSLRQPDAALENLEIVFASEHPANATLARMKAAEIEMKRDRLDAAKEILDRIDEPPASLQRQLLYLQARLQMAGGDPYNSGVVFKQLTADPTGLTERVYHSSYLALADALEASGKREEAVRLIRRFINRFPDSSFLALAFSRLEKMENFNQPGLDPYLARWLQATEEERKALALFYSGIAKKHAVSVEEAIETLEQFVEIHTGHFLHGRAALTLASYHVELRDKESALRVLEDLRKRTMDKETRALIAHLEGRASFTAGEYADAARKFLESADLSSRSKSSSLFNSGIAWIRADDEAGYARTQSLLSELASDDRLDGDLALEKGLFLASRKHNEASDALLQFTKDHPLHPRLAEAYVALAEMHLIELPVPKLKSARKWLDASRQTNLSPRLAERADYVAFWIGIAEGNEESDEVLQRGIHFVSAWPRSALVPDVRMKLGELFYRKKDFPNAQTHFEILARDFPRHPHAEPALFFAGKSCLRSINPKAIPQAIDIWEKVVRMGGPLKLAARQQQALAKRRMGLEREAVLLLDSVLEEKPEGDLLFSSLVAKGEALSVLGRDRPDLLQEAIKVFRSVVDHEGVQPHWRNEALFRIGKCHDQSGDPQTALTAYYDVINNPSAQHGSPEYLWYYRAGFEAMRLLESRPNPPWDSIIAVADKLAELPGPRAEEARKRADRLRLEHFRWKPDL